MLRMLMIMLSLWSPSLLAQETPASPMLMTIGPIDGESDAKSSVITIRYDAKPNFEKPKIEAFGSFLQVVLPQTLVPRPGQFIEANSPYIRKMAAFQLDENTAGLRLFVTKEAAHFLPAFTTDILENRVVIMLDHALAEKNLIAHFDGAPVEGGPSPEEIVQRTEIRSDIPDPVPMTKSIEPVAVETAAKIEAPKVPVAAGETSAAPAWSQGLEQKLVMVTIFVGLMLVLLIALKSWRNMASKKWPLAPTADFSLKTIATHALGPKQKITVVQVGQEQILLGVSGDSINFLTSLRKDAEQLTSPLQLDPSLLKRPLQASPKRPAVLDEVGARPANRTPKAPERMPEPGSSIAYGISDQGVKNYKNSTAPRPPVDPTAVDDVTKLIRKKLRDLPKV